MKLMHFSTHKQLLIKFDSVRDQIKNIRIKTERISYYTLIGATAMFFEKSNGIFLKRMKYMNALRVYYSVSNLI